MFTAFMMSKPKSRCLLQLLGGCEESGFVEAERGEVDVRDIADVGVQPRLLQSLRAVKQWSKLSTEGQIALNEFHLRQVRT